MFNEGERLSHVTADRPQKVNMTAEEEMEDDEDSDVPDFSALKVSAEDALLSADHGSGRFIAVLLTC